MQIAGSYRGQLAARGEHAEVNLDNWWTVHRSITLVDFQLDAQNSYLFIYNTFIKILYMFRALPSHLQEVYNYDVDLLKMSRTMLETCRGF